MSNCKIKSKWGADCFGQQCLIISKARGHISQQELADYLRYDLQEFGTYVTMLNATEATCGVGWPEDDDSQGDTVVLYRYESEERCPVCAHMAIPDYCPHCGNSIDPARDYQETIRVFRGDEQDRKPLYQLACAYNTEESGGVCACGVSDSMSGIMRLLRQHVQGLISLDARDPVLMTSPPSVDKLPATFVYEWDYARLRVEYTVEHVQVLLGSEAEKDGHDCEHWRENPWKYQGENREGFDQLF